MTNHEKRQRLIAMRECLRQAQKKLGVFNENGRMIGNHFICHAIEDTSCSRLTKNDCRDYVYRALQGECIFEGIIEKLNPNRNFSFNEIMDLRRRFIDDLCDRINQELEQLA